MPCVRRVDWVRMWVWHPPPRVTYWPSARGRRAQRRRLFQNLLGLLRQCFDRLSQTEELLFGLADKLHEDLALPTALASKAAHDLL